MTEGFNHEDTKERRLRVASAFDEKTEEVARALVDSCFAVHNTFGPGLLESVYETCLQRELEVRGLRRAVQVPIPIEYRGTRLECGYRIDLLVENTIIVEIKAVERLLPIHEAQLLTYLKLARKRLGFLVNFNTIRIKDGLRRFSL
jgi:GxxExxY protein